MTVPASHPHVVDIPAHATGTVGRYTALCSHFSLSHVVAIKVVLTSDSDDNLGCPELDSKRWQ